MSTQEELIIRQRVLISENHYRRLAKLGTELSGLQNPTKEQIHDLRERILLEIEAYTAMIKKLELQSNANKQEIQHYHKEMQLSEQKIQRLSMRTKTLQQKLFQAEFKRSHNEEYSKIVDEFMKPRKFNIKKQSLDYNLYEGLGKQTVAAPPQDTEAYEAKLVVLNTSRTEFIAQNEDLMSEIVELESLQSMYDDVWSQRKKNFEIFVESLESFRKTVLDE